MTSHSDPNWIHMDTEDSANPHWHEFGLNSHLRVRWNGSGVEAVGECEHCGREGWVELHCVPQDQFTAEPGVNW